VIIFTDNKIPYCNNNKYKFKAILNKIPSGYFMEVGHFQNVYGKDSKSMKSVKIFQKNK
jgi:hypothetical protein